MLREFIIAAAFLFALSAVMASFVIIQKNTESQLTKVEKIIESANEID